jgi:hypothetical protein
MTPKPNYDFHNDRALAALPELASIYPVHDQLGRRVHTLARRLSTPAQLEVWFNELHPRWTRALERLRRARNAVAHGGPVTPSLVDTVHRFGRNLAGSTLSTTLEGLLDGRGSLLLTRTFVIT